MKKAALIILLAFVTTQAQAFDAGSFVNLFATNYAAQSTDIVNKDVLKTLTSMEKQSGIVDAAVQTYFLSVVSKLSGTEESNTMKTTLNSIKNSVDRTSEQKSEAINQLITDYTDTLVLNQSAALSALQALSSRQQNKLVNETTNISKYATQYMNMIEQGSNLATTLSAASENINTIKEITQTVSLYREKAAALMSLVNQINTLARTVGLQP